MERIRAIGEIWKGMKRENREIADAHKLLIMANALRISDSEFQEVWNAAYLGNLERLKSLERSNRGNKAWKLREEEEIEDVAGRKADALVWRSMEYSKIPWEKETPLIEITKRLMRWNHNPNDSFLFSDIYPNEPSKW